PNARASARPRPRGTPSAPASRVESPRRRRARSRRRRSFVEGAWRAPSLGVGPGERGKHHAPRGRLDHVRHTNIDVVADMTGRRLDDHHRSIVEVSDALAVLSALLHKMYRDLVPGGVRHPEL